MSNKENKSKSAAAVASNKKRGWQLNRDKNATQQKPNGVPVNWFKRVEEEIKELGTEDNGEFKLIGKVSKRNYEYTLHYRDDSEDVSTPVITRRLVDSTQYKTLILIQDGDAAELVRACEKIVDSSERPLTAKNDVFRKLKEQYLVDVQKDVNSSQNSHTFDQWWKGHIKQTNRKVCTGCLCL